MTPWAGAGQEQEDQEHQQEDQEHQQEQGRPSPHHLQPLLPLKARFFLSCSSWQSTLKDLFDLIQKTPQIRDPAILLRVYIPKWRAICLKNHSTIALLSASKKYDSRMPRTQEWILKLGMLFNC